MLATRLLSPLTAQVDRAVARVLFHRSERSRARSRAESLGPIERLRAIEEMIEHYGRSSWLTDADSFFPAQEPVDLSEVDVTTFRGGRVVDLEWSSPLAPTIDTHDVVSRIMERAHLNSRAVARLFLHGDRPRPTIILLHGYMGGLFAIEERAFPVSWLFDQGLDVVLGVLPHHGPRGLKGRRPLFPSSDPRITIEAFRHAIVDLRTLASLLRARGVEHIGAMGMSLGGYTSALLATIEPLSFVFPMIPLASIADFALEGDRFVGTATQRREQHAALERLHRVVSPLGRAPKVSGDRALVIAGEGDRITPVSHAKKLAAHFEAPLHTFHGGHLIQLGRGKSFREVARVLERLGLLSARRSQRSM